MPPHASRFNTGTVAQNNHTFVCLCAIVLSTRFCTPSPHTSVKQAVASVVRDGGPCGQATSHAGVRAPLWVLVNKRS